LPHLSLCVEFNLIVDPSIRWECQPIVGQSVPGLGSKMHERMHLTLKKEATKPAAKNLLQQQAKFDHFIEYYNRERPHQALEGRCPAQLYRTSRRPYSGLSDLEYPFHDRTVTVTTCGRICIGRRKINLSQVFAGQNVGIKEVADKIWLVSFMHYDLGFFDHEAGRVECAPNPFGAKVLPMSPE
jgi:putative transposase